MFLVKKSLLVTILHIDNIVAGTLNENYSTKTYPIHNN